MPPDEPSTQFPWDVPRDAWPEWYSAHRDARAEVLCTAREDDTQLVHISASLMPALRELARLGLIEFFELERWDLPREAARRVPTAEASALLDIPARWDAESDKPRLLFGLTEKGLRAAEAEAFHFNDGRFVDWQDEETLGM